ncbi:MAG: ATP-binding protein [Brevinematia bacterium]
MIERIKIKNFGKFKEAEFEFTPVTVFYGKNESGKTTLFDAIFKAVTNVKKTTIEGKNLERYGDLKDSILEIKPDIYEISPDIFLNVLAIRSGEITLDFEKKNLNEEIRERILSSNVNLERLIRNISEITSRNSRSRFCKNRNEVIEDINQLQSTIEELNRNVKEYERMEAYIKKLRETIETKKIDFKNLNEELKSVEDNIKTLEKSKELKILNDNYNELQNFYKRKKELEGIKLVNPEDIERFRKESENLQRLELEKENIKKENQKNLEKLRALENEKNNLKQELLGIEAIFPIIKNLGIFASLSLTFLVSGILSLGISALLFLIFKNPLMLILSVTSFIFLTLTIVFYFLYRNSKRGLLEKVKNFSTKKIKEIFENLKKEKEKLNIRLTEYIPQEVKRLEEEIEKNELLLKDIEREINLLKESIEGFLANNNVRKIDELIQNNERYRLMADQISRMESKLREIAFQHNTELNGLENVLRRKIKDIEELGTTEREYDEAKLNKNVTNKKLLENKIKKISEEIIELEKQLSQKSGEISNFSKIISELKMTEIELEGKKKELELMDKKRMAYEKIQDILNLIDKDAFYKFRVISEEIKNEFSTFFPHLAEVEFKSLEKMQFLIRDGAGELRNFEFLSKGTQDMFLLAFRILLARKFDIFEGEEGFLIFDEPFLSLDKDRIKSMIALLKKFHNENNWQLIFFTKDENLKELLSKTFKDRVRTYNLE